MLKISAIAVACLLLAGCGGQHGISASPSTAATIATATAPTVLDVAARINPRAVDAVNKACPYATTALAIASACVSGGAAGPTGAIAQLKGFGDASCTEAGKLSLVANDTAAAALGPTPSNSGNSADWLLSLVDDAAKIAPVACPIAKALIASAK